MSAVSFGGAADRRAKAAELTPLSPRTGVCAESEQPICLLKAPPVATLH